MNDKPINHRPEDDWAYPIITPIAAPPLSCQSRPRPLRPAPHVTATVRPRPFARRSPPPGRFRQNRSRERIPGRRVGWRRAAGDLGDTTRVFYTLNEKEMDNRTENQPLDDERRIIF